MPGPGRKLMMSPVLVLQTGNRMPGPADPRDSAGYRLSPICSAIHIGFRRIGSTATT